MKPLLSTNPKTNCSKRIDFVWTRTPSWWQPAQEVRLTLWCKIKQMINSISAEIKFLPMMSIVFPTNCKITIELLQFSLWLQEITGTRITFKIVSLLMNSVLSLILLVLFLIPFQKLTAVLTELYLRSLHETGKLLVLSLSVERKFQLLTTSWLKKRACRLLRVIWILSRKCLNMDLKMKRKKISWRGRSSKLRKFK
jgi:hypothetical protein